MATVIKARKPLGEMAIPTSNGGNNSQEDMTVEQYLTKQSDEMILDLQKHAADLINQLRREYQEGAAAIKAMMSDSASKAKRLCVTLKCVAGAHMGQKFRLEPANDNEEDVFKIGRSTGRLFKEKGVSLYKDKEISTTHAKIEIKNGQAFLVDVRSTNGTLLNNVEIEAQVPLRLQNGDVICMGSSELLVQITDVGALDEDENFASV